MMIYLFFLFLVILIVGFGLYGYLKGILSPSYIPEEMMLNHEQIGSGKQKIVLLHGLTGSLKYWKRELDEFSDSYSLLLIDLLGFGASPKPKSKYNLSEHLSAIERVIIKKGFNEGKVIIVGHSLGAILAMGVTANHPEWFYSVAVIGTPVFRDKNAIRSLLRKRSFWDGISVDSRYKFICYFHHIYMTELFRPKNIPREVFQDAAKHTWVSYYHTLDEVILNTDIQKLAYKIKDKKILFIHGEKDTIAPIEYMKSIVNIFTNADFEIFPNGDHQIFLSSPAKIWSLIKKLFTETKPNEKYNRPIGKKG